MSGAGKPIYQAIDHTGDLGMLVFGADLRELFVHAAWGLFDLMTDAERIEPRLNRDLTVEAIDLEDLMVRWLGELLYAYDTHRFLAVNAAFHTLEPTRLQPSCAVRRSTPRVIPSTPKSRPSPTIRLPSSGLTPAGRHGLFSTSDPPARRPASAPRG